MKKIIEIIVKVIQVLCIGFGAYILIAGFVALNDIQPAHTGLGELFNSIIVFFITVVGIVFGVPAFFGGISALIIRKKTEELPEELKKEKKPLYITLKVIYYVITIGLALYYLNILLRLL